MPGSNGAAPTPDGRIADAATKQAELGQEWLNFSKEQFGISQARQAEIDTLARSVADQTLRLAQDQSAYSKSLTDKQLALADEQLQQNRDIAAQQLDSASWQDGIARDDRQRYEDVYRPIEDQYIEEASNYASPERQAEAAAEASADVQTAAARARGTAQREMASMGLNPLSGRWAGVDRAGELGTALGAAGAANAARKGIRDTGLSLKGDLANLGRGVSAQALQTAAQAINTQNSALAAGNAGTALSIGAADSAIANSGAAKAGEASALSSGLSGRLATDDRFLASTGILGQGYAGAQQGQAGMANTLSNLYQLQQNAYADGQARQSNDWSAGLGAIGTIGGVLLSDEELKEDKEPIPDGEALDQVVSMPVETWRYKDGVADDAEHVGTYAQDFQEQTGQGDGHTIPIGDAIGLTMRAVQDLAGQVSEIASAIGLGGRPGPSAKAKDAVRRSAPPDDGRTAPTPPTAPPPTPAALDQAPGLMRRAAA